MFIWKKIKKLSLKKKFKFEKNLNIAKNGKLKKKVNTFKKKCKLENKNCKFKIYIYILTKITKF